MVTCDEPKAESAATAPSRFNSAAMASPLGQDVPIGNTATAPAHSKNVIDPHMPKEYHRS
jgi:hypothetical protein